MSGRRAHDDRLLDALSKITGVSFEGTVWRVVRKGRAVLDESRPAGRWNPRHLSVLYTAMEAEGALAEMYFHLSRGQSVFPSRMEHVLHELNIRTNQTLNLADMAKLVELGVDETRYMEMLYPRTQEIADAAAFLGFDGIIAQSARYPCEVVVLFLDKFDLESIEVASEAEVDWNDWRKRKRPAT